MKLIDCLIPNHFHFLVRVRSEDHILNLANSQYDKFLKNIISKILKDKLNIFDLISEVFRRFFIAYTKAFNIEQKRNGNLFQRPFKRILIDSDEYYSQLIYYIHANPENHGIIKDYKEYKWSSFQSILSVIPTKLERGSVLEWYGGKEGFIKFHSMYQKLENLGDFIIEDKNDFFEMKKR